MRAKKTLLLLPLALVLALAGCSSDSEAGTASSKKTSTTEAAAESTEASGESTAAAVTSEEADGEASAAADGASAADGAIVGSGYTYSVPEGWGQNEDTAALAGSADTLAIDLAATGTFANNVNTIVSTGEFTPEMFEASSSELESAGATDIAVGDRVMLDGVEAGHLTSTMTQSGVTYLVEQFAAARGGVTYIVTFSFATDSTEAERSDAINIVLGSWTWS